jgi:2-methylcitrate dehydratase PrpD
MTGATRSLAQFVAGLAFEDLPPALVSTLKAALLDSLGCGLHGLGLPWVRAVNGLVMEQGGEKEATLWGTGFRGPAPQVALGLGVMIHSFDFDDYHNAKVHAGAAVVPAAMALGEREGIGGRDLLTALAAGYETMIRVSLATGPSASRRRGFHLTGTTGPFGAAAAASRVLGLDAERTASALGLGGTQGAGLWAFTADGAASKRLHPGRAAQGGVLAGLLAARGYAGPTRILEAEDGGFCRAMSDAPDLARLLDGLGARWEALGNAIKPYACCGSLHPLVDAAIDLARAHDLRPEAIARVRALTCEVVDLQCGFRYEPLSVLQAQMSLRYALAVALTDREVLAAQFTPSRIADPALLALAGRVEVVRDPEVERLYPRKFAGGVELVLEDGRRLARRVEEPSGSPARPLAWAQVRRKFEGLAGPAREGTALAEIALLVEGLEAVGDVRALARLLE